MFQHRNAIFWESTITKDHKSNTPIQILTAFTVTIKTLEYKNSRIHSVYKRKPTMQWHQNYVYTVLRLVMCKLTAVWVLSEVCIQT